MQIKKNILSGSIVTVLPRWHLNLAQLKIRTRLTLGFSALAVLMALLGAAALYHLTAIDREFDAVMDDRYPKLQAAAEIKAAVLALQEIGGDLEVPFEGAHELGPLAEGLLQ